MRSGLVRRGSAAAAAALVLAGCGAQLGPDVAARVGKQVISVQEVADAVADAEAGAPSEAALTPTDRVGLQSNVLGSRLQVAIAEEAARTELDVTVSQDEVAELRADAVGELGEEGLAEQLEARGLSEEAFVENLRINALVVQIQEALVPGEEGDPNVAAQRQTALQEFVTGAFADADVEVSPRFGEWDPETGQVVPAVGASEEQAPPGQQQAPPPPTQQQTPEQTP